MLTDESKAECDGTKQQIERLQEEGLWAINWSSLNLVCLDLLDAEKDMCYYTGLTGGQTVAFFNFLNAHGILRSTELMRLRKCSGTINLH